MSSRTSVAVRRSPSVATVATTVGRFRPAMCSTVDPVGRPSTRRLVARGRTHSRRSAHHWELGVLIGPHAAPDYLTADGLDEFLRATWTVHFNSARTGVRLVGPKPLWARPSGGEAGLHPSNIHDTGYAIGSVDITGDTPVILGPDGPSLGGFVCPAVVVAARTMEARPVASRRSCATRPDVRRVGTGASWATAAMDRSRHHTDRTRRSAVVERHAPRRAPIPATPCWRDAARPTRCRSSGCHVPPGRRPVPTRRVRAHDARSRVASARARARAVGADQSRRRRRRNGRCTVAAGSGRWRQRVMWSSALSALLRCRRRTRGGRATWSSHRE